MTTFAGSSGCKGASAYPLFGIVVASMKQSCSGIGIGIESWKKSVITKNHSFWRIIVNTIISD
ncbi:MAG TPA: hypothetical protein VKY57_11555 [Chitinispirillaceae bacterium]|nr:hypothetical protein [Chitinispirillaceae bacterium]